MGDDSEGSRNDGSNGTVPGKTVQGVDAVSVTLWKKKLGGDRGYAQGPYGIPPSGGGTYHRDDGETWGRQILVISISRGGDGLCRDPPHQSIHKESADNHSVEGGLPACLFIVHGGGEDVGDDDNDVMVGSRHSK